MSPWVDFLSDVDTVPQTGLASAHTHTHTQASHPENMSPEGLKIKSCLTDTSSQHRCSGPLLMGSI